MKQTIFSNKERPLLAHAVSKLNPKVFSHPVWVQFSRKAHIPPPETIQALSREAEFLKRDQPGDACQVLLVCAAYQSLAVRKDLALRTTQQALALAERNSLPKEMVWATWGACAICFQESNFEQAARYLEYLQAGLSEQNEWILADFVEMVRQSLLQPGTALTNERPGLSQDRRTGMG